MTIRVNWRGRQVLSKMQRAERNGINRTMAQAVSHAKNHHAWRNRTGTLEGSIQIADFAERDSGGWRGLWGSRDVRYALIHELGGMAGRGLSVRIPRRPYLRPAADTVYPSLNENIRAELAKLP